MSFQPQTFDEAQSQIKPLRRSRMNRTGPLRKKSLTGSIQRERPLQKRPKRRKKLTDGQLKKRVWKQFSIHVRTNGADENGFNQCVTCPARRHWKELQAGHFIRGRLNSNLFDERGVWPQCYSCNVGAQGNVVLYYKFMLEKYGQEVIDELIEQNQKTRKWLPGELKALLDKYRSLNASNPLLEKG